MIYITRKNLEIPNRLTLVFAFHFVHGRFECPAETLPGHQFLQAYPNLVILQIIFQRSQSAPIVNVGPGVIFTACANQMHPLPQL